MSPAELELFFYRRGEAEFSVALRLREPGNEVDQRFEAPSIRIDIAKLSELLHDPIVYGWQLGTALFSCPEVRRAFDSAIACAQRLEGQLRVRLCTDQRSRDDLHRLRWELLRRPDADAPDDPDRAEWLMVRPNLWFSRHLFSGDMRPVRLRRKAELTALVAVASPTNLDHWQPAGRPLAAIDIDGELKIARQGLGPIQREELIPGAERVTLARLLDALRAEPDVLYLVCHGAIIDGEPRLMLERDDGTAEMVSGALLVTELAGLRNLPRLVVLISCQSGGGDATDAGATSALAAIGPRLAEAGVPAVLAMQGDLTMETARRFLPPFFAELGKTGQVDAAVTRGRAAVSDAPDGWVPVLTTRLVEGRVWFTGGLTVAGDDAFRAWKQLVNQINIGKCVPILGSGLLEPFVGASREVANNLAKANGYPMALSGREDLPQVAQFLKTMYDDTTTRLEVFKELSESLGRRWPELNLPPVDAGDPGADLLEKLLTAWREYQRDRPFEPHRYLARMRRIKTIITTNPDDLLVEALKDAGRTPRVVTCSWDMAADDQMVATGSPSGHLGPTEDSPDVYQLFGHLGEPYSVLVTEDDYFRFLTSVTRRQAEKKDVRRDDDLTDDLLRGTLASSALVFLGFRLTDWDFRSLFRVLIDQGGGNNRSRFTHIAVQVDPEDGTHTEAVRARNFIERLFSELVSTRQSGKIAVYWGGVEDFIQDLDRQWQAMQPSAPTPSRKPVEAVV
jgi:SIR2-like domain/CHAT domain